MKYVFEKTALPEWLLGILATVMFIANGSISLLTGGGILTAFGAIIYFIYKNEVPLTRIPAIVLMGIGVIMLILNMNNLF